VAWQVEERKFLFFFFFFFFFLPASHTLDKMVNKNVMKFVFDFQINRQIQIVVSSSKFEIVLMCTVQFYVKTNSKLIASRSNSSYILFMHSLWAWIAFLLSFITGCIFFIFVLYFSFSSSQFLFPNSPPAS